MISPADVLDPQGNIDKAQFPGKTDAEIDVILQAYIDRAYAILDARGITDDAVRDVAATLYVYYLAADRVYRKITMEAATLAFTDDGSRSMLQTQIDSWGKRADEYLMEFNAIAPVPVPPSGTTNRAATTSVPTVFSW